MHRWLMATDRILLFVANCWIQIFISIYQRLGIENCYSSSFQNRQKPIDKPEKTTDKPFLLQYPLRFFSKNQSVFATESDRFCRFLQLSRTWQPWHYFHVQHCPNSLPLKFYHAWCGGLCANAQCFPRR
jgi:hypothetical protein